MTELQIIDNQEYRNEMIDRIDVLDKVKALLLIPELDGMTIPMLSDYFSVDTKAVRKCYERNQVEIDQDGVALISFGNFSMRQNVSLKTARGQAVFLHPDGIEMSFPTRGAKVFPKRAILRIGMLLRDSEIAKEIRTQLLNTFEKAAPEQRTMLLAEETLLQANFARVQVDKTATKADIVEASAALAKFQNRHITNLKQTNKELAAEILTWDDRAKFNKTVRYIAGRCGKRAGAIYNEIYDELLYKHHIGLKMRGKPPIAQIRETEWGSVQQVLLALCEQRGIDLSQLRKKLTS